ncbi:MAG: YciI family protein [Sphingobium sp.]|jgi:uncharacterized protein YciI|nr:YciI family protein [Sphingobium sp.]MCI1271364.1 YciI family protein [Sphingobium sp.]MCI1756876.1 YciI family protein [Sphingobium sp.]MCI2053997.1 YciI family protein [Sphingobium sp.]
MFILSIRYTAPLEEVDRHRPAHLDWLRAGHEAGHFIGWGRRTPPTGGIVLARGDRAQVEALALEDPFITGKVAEVEVIEWTPSFLGAGLEALAS